MRLGRIYAGQNVNGQVFTILDLIWVSEYIELPNNKQYKYKHVAELKELKAAITLFHFYPAKKLIESLPALKASW